MKKREKPSEAVWSDFKKKELLSDEQLAAFKQYESFLDKSNQEFNLTAITGVSAVVRQHFVDSLMLKKFFDLKSIKTIADIGTGAGFPAIPLKIIFPHLNVILIEVTKKKQRFLEELVDILGLKGVEFSDLDWRTFLRKTDYDVDLFVTRAALDERELCRAFKPACRYNKATMAYWVSELWESEEKYTKFVRRIEVYKLGLKRRKMAFLGLNKEQ